MKTTAIVWLLAGLSGTCLLSWYATDDGFWALSWIGTLTAPETAPALWQVLQQDRWWLAAAASTLLLCGVAKAAMDNPLTRSRWTAALAAVALGLIAWQGFTFAQPGFGRRCSRGHGVLPVPADHRHFRSRSRPRRRLRRRHNRRHCGAGCRVRVLSDRPCAGARLRTAGRRLRRVEFRRPSAVGRHLGALLPDRIRLLRPGLELPCSWRSPPAPAPRFSACHSLWWRPAPAFPPSDCSES